MPRKIGRYEILGELAQGGMAEIHLARLVGPSGFERPVVLKRIRGDLDKHEFTGLFIEEARLAAKVRHANVVYVEDLGTDEGLFYIVMEYLEGENTANLTRRLLARGEPLPIGLAAYVVAEACAGLHAAHELRDEEGTLLGLVHRDVSPQNVFLTYAGAVKVVDFGVAQTGQATEGVVRGKFGYMAPEQLSGGTVDRRTDVFALGIILYELATGRRLFKKFSAEATKRALLNDPILPPRRVAPAVPEAIEKICMRALARDPAERYATAADMRRDLLVANRELASEEPSAELAALMARCFADRIEEKRVMLRTVREGSVMSRVPVGDVDVTIEIPIIDEEETLRAWETGPRFDVPRREPLVTSTVVLPSVGKRIDPSTATPDTAELEPEEMPEPIRGSRILRVLGVGAVAAIVLALVGGAALVRRTSKVSATPSSPPAVSTEVSTQEPALAIVLSSGPASPTNEHAATPTTGSARALGSARTMTHQQRKPAAPSHPAASVAEPATPGTTSSSPEYRRFK